MLKKSLSLIALSLMISFTSCKEKSQEVTEEKVESKQNYSIKNEDISLTWTGYKTTDKIAVSGTFNEIEITHQGEGENAIDALNKLSFSIPVESIYSKDSIRDYKLKTFLFGKMIESSSIKGDITINEGGTGEATISLNGVSKAIPLNYSIENDHISIDSNIDLNNWEAQAAVAALNEVCRELHTGPDGEAKTWSEVAIHVDIKTSK